MDLVSTNRQRHFKNVFTFEASVQDFLTRKKPNLMQYRNTNNSIITYFRKNMSKENKKQNSLLIREYQKLLTSVLAKYAPKNENK